MAQSYLEILENQKQFKTWGEMMQALKETERETGMTLTQWMFGTEEGQEYKQKADAYRLGSPDPFMPADYHPSKDK